MTLTAQPQKERYLYLDVMKIIGIIFVVLYHCRGELLFVDFLSYISPVLSICVPVFFFVNGALLLNRELNLQKHIKKILKIIVLLIIWDFIILTSKMVINNNYLTLYDFLDTLLYLKQPWTHYLWFFRSLIIIYLLFPLFKSLYDTHKTYFCFIAIFLLILSVGSSFFDGFALLIEKIFGENVVSEFFHIVDDVLHFYGIDFKNFTYAIAIFLFGGIFHSNYQKIKEWFSTKKLYQKVLLVSGLMILMLLSSVSLKLYANEYMSSDAVWFGMGTCFTFVNVVCLALLSLWLVNGMHDFFASISKNTLSIYLIHCVIKEVLFLLIRVIPIPASFLTTFFTFVLCFGLSYLIGWLMTKNKYLKFLITM